MKSKLVHHEDPKRSGYYRCNHAIGRGNKDKLTKNWPEVTCKNCKKQNKYHFGIKTNPKLGLEAVILQDNTHIILDSAEQTATILLPKKKFARPFKKAIADRTQRYFGFTFTRDDVNATMKGLEMLEKRRLKKERRKRT